MTILWEDCIYKSMTKEELIDRLSNLENLCKGRRNKKHRRRASIDILLEYINSNEVKEAFTRCQK